MKKQLTLAAVNAKYSHTSLSVRSLKSYLVKQGFAAPCCVECTINDPYFIILDRIMKADGDIVGLSCYIWNAQLVKQLSFDIKALAPEKTLFIGGPEVSFRERDVFSEYAADFIIKGEGELPLSQYLQGIPPETIKGIMTPAFDNGLAGNVPLEDIPFVYGENDLAGLQNRAVYYETTRGCPFHCSFCISSLSEGVRALPMDRIKRELQLFIDKKIRKVKLVDRTFNYDRKRAYEIFQYIIENSRETCFHFEVGADLFDEETLELLKTAPAGIIQFEAGVQTTNSETSRLICRTNSLEKLKHNVGLLKQCKMRLHLDLIAGLPKEDLQSFYNSFDEIYRLKPDILQLGFLKMLYGSKIRREADLFHYIYRKEPPYEVLKNDSISFPELMRLKDMEEAVEIYHNSRSFVTALNYVFDENEIRPSAFFDALGQALKGEGRLSFKEQFALIGRIYRILELKKNDDFLEHLKYDYVQKNRGPLPGCFANFKSKQASKAFFELLDNEEAVLKYFPWLSVYKPKERKKIVDFELFCFEDEKKLFAFDRKNGIVVDLSPELMYNGFENLCFFSM